MHSHNRFALTATTTDAIATAAHKHHHRHDGLTQKSKSLNDILFLSLNASPFTASRSRSSIVATNECYQCVVEDEKIDDLDTLKPKLVKQKKSICEDDFDVEEDRDKATDMRKLIKELPIFKVSLEKPTEKYSYNVLKQRSLTEDVMSSERLKERERVRQNIQKQASLNEDLIYRYEA